MEICYLFPGVAQVVCEGMDDTRVDLSQLEDPGTGRSVPTTPLQVSPQGTLPCFNLKMIQLYSPCTFLTFYLFTRGDRGR